MTTTRTENDALGDLLATSALSETLEPGNFYAFKHNDHVTTIDLLDKHLERPRRKKGVVRVEDIASFAQYYKKHADPDSEVYVNIQAGMVTAVLDAHQETDTDETRDDSARWGEHRLLLILAHTDAWQRWTGKNRELIRQAEFADFIDDNRADIRRPSAAEMLELVQHFQTQKKVTFNSAIVLSNGDRRLTFEEETSAGSGAKGQIEVPSGFRLGDAEHVGDRVDDAWQRPVPVPDPERRRPLHGLHPRQRRRGHQGRGEDRRRQAAGRAEHHRDARHPGVTNGTTTSAGLHGGGGLPHPAPLPRSATITVTQRFGGRVTVDTWDTCHGVADFITRVLGEPGTKVEATHE
ncbi:DUF2303 family protein [Streptosporangium sp. NPDC049078]|uniref:DUF2303 family protein n=1 Tax=Streptosporangium sp. NPDC049078 TaxID=3155767 RepID=UPI00344A85BF